ncbi:MAG: hypothetical protein WBE02_21195, partial [Bradyrhizobium sp.]
IRGWDDGECKIHSTSLVKPMLNSREGRVFVELNYPHIIGIWGYERHHVMGRLGPGKYGQIRPKRTRDEPGH